MSAWLGLVPKQYSTGGKSNLGGISKRGNVYLRRHVILGAKALKIHMKRDKSALGQRIAKLEATHHHHVVLIALANKIMRICWRVLTSGQEYQPYPASLRINIQRIIFSIDFARNKLMTEALNPRC